MHVFHFSVCLPEALRQTNVTMKERFEGLSVWREKQREEREFLEGRLEEARSRMEALTIQNKELSKRLEAGGAPGGRQVRLRAGVKPQKQHIQTKHMVLIFCVCAVSEWRAGRPACPGCSPAGRKERPGGHEFRAAAEGGAGLS